MTMRSSAPTSSTPETTRSANRPSFEVRLIGRRIQSASMADEVVVGGAAGRLAGDDLLELVHLEPVQHPLFHGLDEVAGLDLRLLPRVAAHEARPLEDDVVEFPGACVVRADGADEGSGAEP